MHEFEFHQKLQLCFQEDQSGKSKKYVLKKLAISAFNHLADMSSSSIT
jgi:hypothetical protein